MGYVSRKYIKEKYNKAKYDIEKVLKVLDEDELDKIDENDVLRTFYSISENFESIICELSKAIND